MAITFTNEGASANPDLNSATNATSYTNTAWTPPTSGIIFCFATYRVGAGTAAAPSMTGNGITWTKVSEAIVTTRGSCLFVANAASSVSGTNTWDFAGVSQNYFTSSFFSATGVDLAGGAASAIVQAVTATGTAVSGSATLAASANAANRPISFFFHAANEAVTPRTNWTELDDLAGTADVRGSDSQYRGDAFETTASASWTTSAVWIGIAAEVKASVGYSLDSQPGSYAVSGVAVSALAGRVLSSDPGAYTFTGFAATAVSSAGGGATAFDAQPGSFTLTGVAVGALADRVVSSDPGSFVLTGAAVSALADRLLSANPGAFALSGVDAALIADRVVAALAGSFTVSGQAATVVVDRVIQASPGEYLVTGVATTLDYSGAPASTARLRLLIRVGE